MSMNYKEVSGGLPEKEAEKYAQGITLVGNFVDSLQRQGLLPKRFKRSVVLGKAILFTDEERRALVDDGAVLYLPTGETIVDQERVGRPFWYIADGFKINCRNRLTEFPSRVTEVAIYPDPKRFFVPDTFSRTTDQQIDLIEADAQTLRKRLGLSNIGEILPEASEATEVIFKHFDVTGVRLLGQDYIKDEYWSYIRTATPTNKEGSRVVFVGYFRADYGVYVSVCSRVVSHVGIGAARWVVPTGTR